MNLPLFEPSAAYARWWSSLWQIWWGRSAGPQALDAERRFRLDALVRFARRNSPLYGDAYRGVPDQVFTPEPLPVMTKHRLMSRFDDWVTDATIRRRDINAFLADRKHVGEPFRDRYLVWKSSGSTGEPGIYVQDREALSVYDALIAAQLASPELASRWAAGLLLNGGRAALVAVIGEHFASTASWERLCRSTPGIAARSFSIMEPLEHLVADLNLFAPAYLASYPTMLSLLADERTAGRLHVNPAIVWSGGECLSGRIQTKLERAFRCPVVAEYGASECMSIAFGCREGWLHVNADWVLLEPVDRNFRPTPAGETSDTVLVTNLANRVQPIIRYDLGDAVLAKPEPCACGNPLPAIRVEGRRDDIVVMRSDDGREVRLVPQALTTVVEEATDVHQFQIARSGKRNLTLRLAVDDPERKQAAFAIAVQALRGYLAKHGIADPHIRLDECPPTPDARSRKLRQVIVEHDDGR